MNHGQKSIDELLGMPCWVIDTLPKRVPENSPGQYFTANRYFRDTQLESIRQKHANIILKLNCYEDIALEDEINPAPERLIAEMRSGYVNIRVGDALITSDKDDPYIAVFNAGEELMSLIRELAASEGLFVRKGQ